MRGVWRCCNHYNWFITRCVNEWEYENTLTQTKLPRDTSQQLHSERNFNSSFNPICRNAACTADVFWGRMNGLGQLKSIKKAAKCLLNSKQILKFSTRSIGNFNQRQSMTACSYCFNLVEYCTKKQCCIKCRGVNKQLSKLRQNKLGPVVFVAVLAIKKCFWPWISAAKYLTGKNGSELEHQLQASVGCVGHMFFKCDEMRLSSDFYCQNIVCFTEIYL